MQNPQGPGYGNGYGPPPGGGYGMPTPQHGFAVAPQPPKKKMGLGKVALLVVGGLFAGCMGLGALGAAAGGGTASAKGSTASAPVAPWVADVRSNCAAYRAAPNDIKKSAVYRANESVLGSASVPSARGKLTRLRTNQGGSDLDIEIKTADGVEFQNSPLNSIASGSAIYNAVADMKVGDCVEFSATEVSSASIVEQSKVCSLDYFVKFATVSSCR